MELKKNTVNQLLGNQILLSVTRLHSDEQISVLQNPEFTTTIIFTEKWRLKIDDLTRGRICD